MVIINSGIDLSSSSDQDLADIASNLTKSQGTIDSPRDNERIKQSVQSLSASSKIDVKKVKKGTFAPDQTLIYFISNSMAEVQGSRYYRMYFDANGEYTLQDNENLIVVPNTKDKMIVYSAGTLVQKKLQVLGQFLLLTLD